MRECSSPPCQIAFTPAFSYAGLNPLSSGVASTTRSASLSRPSSVPWTLTPAFSNFGSTSFVVAYSGYPFSIARRASKFGLIFETPTTSMSSCREIASATRFPIVPYPLIAILAGTGGLRD